MTDPASPAPLPLSESGRVRKHRMLAELQSAMTRLTSRRRTLRAAGGIGVFALAVAAAWAGVLLHRGPAPVPQGPVARGLAPVSDLPALRHIQLVSFSAARSSVVVVQTDLSRVAGLVAADTPGIPAQVVTDEELMRMLETTGNSYGLVRTGDHVTLTCYSCPTPQPAPGKPAPAQERPAHPGSI